ncbi:MAG: hypothetical protein RL398_1397 [Planctomycetota bacterium]|jgi:hypothetical protein
MRPAALLLSALSVAVVVACSAEKAPEAPAKPVALQSPPPGFDPLPADFEVSLATPLVEGIPGSPGHLIKSDRNPNGDSELSHLMRLFVDDLRDARAKLEAGGKPTAMYDRHRRMRAAWPTNVAERNEAYDLRAQGYLAAVRAFDVAPTKDAYNAILAGCIACHSVSCGGPIDFIDGMKWQ